MTCPPPVAHVFRMKLLRLEPCGQGFARKLLASGGPQLSSEVWELYADLPASDQEAGGNQSPNERAPPPRGCRSGAPGSAGQRRWHERVVVGVKLLFHWRGPGGGQANLRVEQAVPLLRRALLDRPRHVRVERGEGRYGGRRAGAAACQMPDITSTSSLVKGGGGEASRR